MEEFEFSPLSDRMPKNIEAEQSVLGSVLIEPSCMERLADTLSPSSFYVPRHKLIYSAMFDMFMLNRTMDLISIMEQLKTTYVDKQKTRTAYDEMGGKAYLLELAQMVPSVANLEVYAGIVKEKSFLRQLMEAAGEIIKDVEQDSGDASLIIDSAEQRIFDIRQGKETTGLTHIKEVIQNETYERLTKLNNEETRQEYIGIPTGFAELDKITTGFNKSDLIIVGARPGAGKTAFALKMCREVGVRAGKTVAFFSLEMTRDQLAQRLISAEAFIESQKMRTGEISSDEWARIAIAGEKLAKANIFFDESSGITVPEMKAKLRRMKPRPDFVIVDYLGLIHSAKKQNENRVQEISDITRNLKIMAKELSIPVMVCAQLRRDTVKSNRPSLTDLRESGSIEQDADVVMFIYRESYAKGEAPDPEHPVDETKAECIVAKNRHGGTDTVDMHWEGKYTLFTPVDPYDGR